MSECKHTLMMGSGREIELAASECPKCLNAEIKRLRAELEAVKTDLSTCQDGNVDLLSENHDLKKQVYALRATIARMKWLDELFAKFPNFDPNWSEQEQMQWHKDFREVIEMVRKEIGEAKK
jgi:hypothetical protein